MKRLLAAFIYLTLTLVSYAQPSNRATIAIAGLFHAKQLSVESLPSQPLLVRAGTRALTLGAASGQRVTIVLSKNGILIQTQSQTFHVTSISFTGQSGDADLVLSIPSRFRRTYRGTLTITSNTRELLPVISMDRETAVASIVAAEAGPNYPIEALKALAVAARSYLVAGAPRHPYAEFCDTTHCQFLRNPPAANSPAALATDSTRGLVLTFNGRAFASMYSASCGGRTHTLAGLGLPQRDYPYYAVECLYCRRHPERWTTRLTESEAASASSGERGRIELARKLGWNVVASNDFKSSPVPGGAELTGVGHGHGLGLCQRGAADMARGGQDFRAILAHYYPNTVVDSLAR